MFDGATFAGSIWQIVDVTRHRLWQEELRRTDEKFRVILDNLNAGLCETDLEGNIVKVYESFCRLSGYSEEELLGRNITDVFVPEENREYARNLRRYRVEKKVALLYDMEIVLKDGTRKWVLASSGNIYDRDGVPVGGVGLHMDITPQKALQKELEAAKQAAEDAQRTQKEFLANMSHEIRTPMNGVIGMTSLLQDTPLNADQRSFVDTIQTSGDALLTIINDILDFSKIESGHLDLEEMPFDLRDCVEDSLEVVSPKAMEKGLDLAYLAGDDAPPVIVGDLARLRQVLVNLLSNAVKFTPRGEVRLEVDAGAARELRFAVVDTGIGIPPERLDRLFQSFSQVDASTTRQFGGTGLGLAISRSLVERMGGACGWRARRAGARRSPSRCRSRSTRPRRGDPLRRRARPALAGGAC